MKEYTSMENNGQLKPGTYKGKWTGWVITVNGKKHTDVYTDISVKGIDIAVRLEVDNRKIKVFLD